ncbi:MAG: 50S ribosomal protein L22 [Dethiobacteria bacterium]|jgi:large subunit ribosomal protein L22|nr:50S ribosomal protein L22 [Dethiobacteria bacterium]
MEARAQARYVRLAPRKARAVVDLIRNKNVDEAMSILRYTPRRAAEAVSKVVKSAAANAENNFEMNRGSLYVDQIYVDEGPSLKRVQPRARGRRFLILKRTSHITVIVKERKGV